MRSFPPLMTAPIALLGRNLAEDLVEGVADVFVHTVCLRRESCSSAVAP